MPGDIEQVTAQLTALVRAKTGDAGARAHSLESLPGHAGFSYSFILDRSDPGATPAGKYVVRIAPPGVKISGPADIMRQARVMASLADTPVAVPPIIWYGDEPEFFERPYFVGGFVEGFKLGESTLPLAHLKRLARNGIATMAALHNVPWEPRRTAWGEPFALSEELKRLDYLLDRPTLDPAVVARAPELRERSALEPARGRAHRMRPRRLPMVERAVQRGTRRRADRLGNLAGRRDAARPRLDLLFFRPRKLGRRPTARVPTCAAR